jgi:hypothetical protein
MIRVEEVDLRALGLTLPSAQVGMVVAQPFVQLTSSEPYRWQPVQQQAQLDTIARTLTIAEEAPHGLDRTHFTIFPEYGIPGLAGVEMIDRKLNEDSWPNGTLVIGGVDGLAKDEYNHLIHRPGTHYNENNQPDSVAAHEWVNCAVVWVKSEMGQVENWIQPKIAPAVPEWNTSYKQMFCGKAVYLFRAKYDNEAPCLFFALICFDWIANQQNAGRLWQCVLREINRLAREIGATLPLSWAFVLQRNDKPSDKGFLRGAADLFESQGDFPSVRRENACVVFANNAGSARPGKVTEYGYSALVFSPNAPLTLTDDGPTYASRGKLLRGIDLLDPCLDILFRENGACIYSFAQRVPGFGVVDSSGRTPPVERPYVYPIPNAAIDPRTPSGQVAATVKWLNDSLDSVNSLRDKHPAAPLAGEVTEIHAENVHDLRLLDGPAAHRCVLQSTCKTSEKDHDNSHERIKATDCWGTEERNSLEHVVNTLDILRLCFLPTHVPGSTSHGTITIRGRLIEVAALRGRTHEECVRYSKRLPLPRHTVLVVSRDDDNTSFLPRFGNYLAGGKTQLEKEPKFIDPEAAKLIVGYQELLSAYMLATTTGQLEELLHGTFAP